MDPSGAGAGTPRRKAEQWLSVAEKLLVARDLEGCKQFASQALAADPHTPGADDLHAAASVLLASQRFRLPNGTTDPYAALGLDPTNPASRHPDAIRSHYRRLSFLLNRSRLDRSCSLAFADAARLVADAWSFLSDPVLKSALDSELDAAADAAAATTAAAAARAYHSPAPNLLQPQSQSPLPARSTPPSATPSPRPTPPPAAPTQRPTPPPAAPNQRLTPSPAAPTQWPTQPPSAPTPRPTPPPAAPSLRPTPPPAASPPRSTRRPAAPQARPTPPPAAAPPKPTPPPQIAPQIRPSPPPPAHQTPATATVPVVQSGAAPSSTFWTVCSACCHIHQYDRHYETCKLLCPSCRQPFVAKVMAEPPPIVPGTDMYYCTWGFFPVGFPGCPGFQRLVNSQSIGLDQQKAPWLGAPGAEKGNVRDNAENGVPVSAAVEVPVEAPAVTPPAKPMRVKVGAKKRGRPKGSKNKKKL